MPPDKKQVKSLWHSYAPAAWSPVTVNEGAVKGLISSHSLKELRKIASQLGIDSKLGKLSTAISIVAEKNVFFPEESGHYDHNTLVYFVRQFKLLPSLTDADAFKMTSVQLQKIVLDGWKGGTEDLMNSNLQHVIELHEIMQSMEDKFCSHKVKRKFREPNGESPSLYDYVENSMADVLDKYKQWLAVSSDIHLKRKLFVATQMAYNHAETSVTQYLRMIRIHCKIECYNECDAKNMPKSVENWLQTSPWDDRIVMCNVTVKGRFVKFREGDTLIPGYTIGIVYKTKDNSVWIGIGKPTDEYEPVNESKIEPLNLMTSGKPDIPMTSGKPDIPMTSGKPDIPVTSRKPDIPVTSGTIGTPMTTGTEPRTIPIQERKLPEGIVILEPIPEMKDRVPEAEQNVLEPEQRIPEQEQRVLEPEQRIPEPANTFKSKAMELVKDAISLGMNVTSQIVWSVILGSIIPTGTTINVDIPGPLAIGTGDRTKEPTEQKLVIPQQEPLGRYEPLQLPQQVPPGRFASIEKTSIPDEFKVPNISTDELKTYANMRAQTAQARPGVFEPEPPGRFATPVERRTYANMTAQTAQTRPGVFEQEPAGRFATPVERRTYANITAQTAQSRPGVFEPEPPGRFGRMSESARTYANMTAQTAQGRPGVFEPEPPGRFATPVERKMYADITAQTGQARPGVFEREPPGRFVVPVERRTYANITAQTAQTRPGVFEPEPPGRFGVPVERRTYANITAQTVQSQPGVFEPKPPGRFTEQEPGGFESELIAQPEPVVVVDRASTREMQKELNRFALVPVPKPELVPQKPVASDPLDALTSKMFVIKDERIMYLPIQLVASINIRFPFTVIISAPKIRIDQQLVESIPKEDPLRFALQVWKDYSFKSKLAPSPKKIIQLLPKYANSSSVIQQFKAVNASSEEFTCPFVQVNASSKDMETLLSKIRPTPIDDSSHIMTALLKLKDLYNEARKVDLLSDQIETVFLPDLTASMVTFDESKIDWAGMVDFSETTNAVQEWFNYTYNYFYNVFWMVSSTTVLTIKLGGEILEWLPSNAALMMAISKFYRKGLATFWNGTLLVTDLFLNNWSVIPKLAEFVHDSLQAFNRAMVKLSQLITNILNSKHTHYLTIIGVAFMINVGFGTLLASGYIWYFGQIDRLISFLEWYGSKLDLKHFLHQVYEEFKERISTPQAVTTLSTATNPVLKDAYYHIRHPKSVIPHDRFKKFLQRHRMKAGSVFSSLPVNMANVEQRAPTLVGNVTIENIMVVPRKTDTNTLSRLVQERFFPRTSSSVTRKLEKVKLDFHRKFSLKPVKLDLLPGVPSVSLANQPNVDSSTYLQSEILSNFSRDILLEHKSSLNSVSESISSTVGFVANILAAEPVENRPAVLMESLRGLDEEFSDIDSIVGITAAVLPIVTGQYHNKFNESLNNYCFVGLPGRMPLIETSSSSTSQNFVGIIKNNQFVNVSSVNGPIFVSGTSLLSSVVEDGGSGHQMMTTLASIVVDYVNYVTATPLTKEIWTQILVRTSNISLVLGFQIQNIIGSMTIVDQALQEATRLNNELKEWVLKAVSVGVDPLSVEFVNIPFRMDPSSVIALSWTNLSPVQSIYSAIWHNKTGYSMVNLFKSWLVTHSPKLVEKLEHELDRTDLTRLDPNVAFFSIVNWLASNLMGAMMKTVSQTSISIRSGIHRLNIPNTPRNIYHKYKQDIRTQFGVIVSEPILNDAKEVLYVAKEFLSRQNTSGFFDLFIVSVVTRALSKGQPLPDITPRLWSASMIQANTLMLMCDRLPHVETNNTPKQTIWSKMQNSIRGMNLGPFEFDSHVSTNKVGANSLLTSTSLSHGILLGGSIAPQYLNRIHKIIEFVTPSLIPLVEQCSRDLELFCRVNGSEVTSIMWSMEKQFCDLMEFQMSMASDNTTLISRADSKVVSFEPVKPKRVFMEKILKSLTREQKRELLKRISTEVRRLDDEDEDKRLLRLWEKDSLGKFQVVMEGLVDVAWKVWMPLVGFVISPEVAVTGLITQQVAKTIADTEWWKQTERVLQFYIGKWGQSVALMLLNVGTGFLVYLCVGQFRVWFDPDRVRDYADLLRNSPLESLYYSSRLDHQLTTIGATETARNIMTSLQHPNLQTAAIRELGTSMNAIQDFIRGVGQEDTRALATFINTFRFNIKEGLLTVLQSHSFTDRMTEYGLSQTNLDTLQSMITTSATFMSSQRSQVSTAVVTCTEALLAFALKLHSANRLPGIQQLQSQLALIPR
jgi:hypothetical protein